MPEMLCIYVGDSGNVVGRIRRDHCGGGANVEGSALRKAIAEVLGFRLVRKLRPSGKTKLQIDAPDPAGAEAEITAYLRKGRWRVAIAESYVEAHDFQWYVVNRMNPALNKHRESWRAELQQRYELLFQMLDSCVALDYDELRGKQSGPGVYVLYHDHLPERS
jgi:hypothetical protein